MSTPLVQVTIALTVGSAPAAVGAAAQASIAAVVTDSTGVAQAAVQLTGNETPTAWEFNASVAPGNSTVVFTLMDVNGSPITVDGNGNSLVPLSVPFTEAGAAPSTLQIPLSATVTPVSGATAPTSGPAIAAAAAARTAALKR